MPHPLPTCLSNQATLPAGKVVVVLDHAVPDAAQLRQGLDAGAQAVLVHGDADGLTQIAAALAGQTGLSSLTIVAHGVPGGLDLGATRLDTASVLQANAAVLAQIGASLAPDGTVQLVACAVAAGVEGQIFLQALANALQASLCASTRTVGGVAGWELDAWASPYGRVRSRAARLPITPATRAAYAHALPGGSRRAPRPETLQRTNRIGVVGRRR